MIANGGIVMTRPTPNRRLRRIGVIILAGGLALTALLVGGGTLVAERMTGGGDARALSRQGDAPPTSYLDRPGGRIAYDDSGGTGPLVIAVPSMGDLRQEYRFLRP